MLRNNYTLFYGPEDSQVPSGAMSVDDMQSFLKDDAIDLKDNKVSDKTTDDKIDIVDDDNDKVDDDDEDKIDLDAKEEDEPEEEEPLSEEDERLELMAHVNRKEILKEFPELFKKFPYLERAYYRNLQFTEYFSKPEEAKRALDDSQTLRNFETQLLDGDIEATLKAVKAENEESFHKLVDNYLTTLETVDPKMWDHVVGNLNKQTIYAMYVNGKRTNNENLMMAALELNKFIFGTDDYEPPQKLAREEKKSSKEAELEEKEKKFNESRLNTYKKEVTNRTTSTIKNTIEVNIDPKNAIENQFLKDKIVEEAQNNLDKLMQSDKKYVKLLETYWAEANKSDYDTKILDKIKSAIINKAKVLLPEVIRAARNKALKNGGTRSSNEGLDKKGPAKMGKPASPNSGGGNKSVDPKSIPADMSSRDFLMQD